MKFINYKKGFSLLEIILVLGVGSVIAFMKFQDMIHDQEDFKASASGQQIKQLGEAVNGYINIRYDRLAALSASLGTGTDPGPRTCDTSSSICNITYQTLINEGLLPSTYVAKNSFGSDYSIQLKRRGTGPNYIIDGIIVSNSAWVEGGKIRYDLLGKAMQVAGIDSGMSKTTTKMDGYGGGWNYTNSDFNALSKVGMLGYRVGYNSAMYSVYLRRDGTLPMTGNLNMGANDINNAKNITASGIGSFGGNITSGANISATGEVSAHNGYGDLISMGGDASSNDYEIRLGSAKPLKIYSPNATQYTTVFAVNSGNSQFGQRISTMGYDPNELPSGWGGGVRTLDVYAAGTVATGSNGNLTSYMNASGFHTGSDVIASGNVSGNGVYGNYIKSNGNIDASNDINAGHQVNTQYVWASGNLNSNYVHSNGNIDANGRINSGEFVYINGQANVGWGCSPNGLLGRTGNGVSLSCVDGIWKASSPNVQVAYGTATAWRWPHAYANCPGGTQLVGGGGNCQSIPAANGYMQVVGSMPNGNGWHVYCDTSQNQNAIANAWAYCI